MFGWARPALPDRPRGRRASEPPYDRIPGFLPEPIARSILEQLLARREDFRPLTGDRNFLRLPRPLDVVPGFSEPLLAILPDVQRRFGIDMADPEVELYVHAYNHGTWFGRHSDAHGGGNWRRRISCVYYLHGLPRAFDGGDLVVYDERGRGHAVPPEHNSLVLFPSHLVHEVRPVACRSRAFADSRFAINVWIM